MKRNFALLAAVLVVWGVALAQEPASGVEGDRREAMDLMREHRELEAVPLLEKLAVALPNDAAIHEELGMALVTKAAVVNDLEGRKQTLRDARSYLMRAKELGAHDDLLEYFLSTVSPDGTPPHFSDKKEIQAAMDEGEAAFAKREWDAAVRAYTRALILDPNLYSAALYIGDSYFGKKTYGSAIEWFKRAAEIDPDRETAYRYWGDSLMQLGRMDEAKEQFLRAIVAEPYQQRPWVGLKQWGQKQQLVLSQPHIEPKAAVTAGKNPEKGDLKITLDSDSLSKDKNDPSGGAWVAYGLSRALWHGEKFHKEFPNEKEYRHTLREEADALHMAATVLSESNKKKKPLPPDLAKLADLDAKGMLEPYILLSAPDNDIAKDYESYREKNRDKLLQYLREYITAEKKEN